MPGYPKNQENPAVITRACSSIWVIAQVILGQGCYFHRGFFALYYTTTTETSVQQQKLVKTAVKMVIIWFYCIEMGFVDSFFIEKLLWLGIAPK